MPRITIDPNKKYHYKIYLITDKSNKKIYIGQTRSTIEHRFRQHMCRINHTKVSSQPDPFTESIRQNGQDNFSITTLWESFCTISEINQVEIEYIAKYDATNPSIGYNKSTGGGQPIAEFKLSPEACRKITQAKTGVPLTKRRNKTLQRDIQIIELFLEGMCRAQIQFVLGITKCSVIKALHRYKKYVDPTLDLSSDRDLNTIVTRLHKYFIFRRPIYDDIISGLSYREVCDKHHTQPHDLKKSIEKYCDYQTLIEAEIHENFMKDFDIGQEVFEESNIVRNKQIHELFEQNYTRRQIAHKLNVEYGIVKIILRGCKNSVHFKHTLPDGTLRKQ